jgi:hypothetical protein
MNASGGGLLALAALLVVSSDAGAAGAQPIQGEMPEYQAADPAAPAVTDANLLASERFWPYRVALREPFRPASREKPLPSGSTGVLIRVEQAGRARIDFGRDGLHDVPVGKTDLVEQANRVRLGEVEKAAPNFVYSMAPRLGDSESAEPRELPLQESFSRRLFLAVFADPGAQPFPQLAAALAPLRERDGMLTILFPQGEHPDLGVRDQLRSLGWTVPFVFDHLAEPYTRTLLDEGLEPPALVLQTAEGRVLFQGAWARDAVARLHEAVDATLGPAPAAAAASD